MKELKKIARQLRDELEVAEEYAQCAATLKETRPSDASSYAEMAKDELDHAETLHKMAVKAIEKQRVAGEEAQPAMQAVWDWEHEQMIDRIGKVKALLAMA